MSHIYASLPNFCALSCHLIISQKLKFLICVAVLSFANKCHQVSVVLVLDEISFLTDLNNLQFGLKL